MLRAPCHLERPGSGVGWKEKVGAVHAGSRIGWAKGVWRGRERLVSGRVTRGGHAAAPCVLGVNSQIRRCWNLESGSA